MGKVEEAIQLLEKLAPTAEHAVALKGAEREAYLGALDTVHGPQAERAKNMGFNEDTMYHGTMAPNIQQFDTGKEGLFGSGSYFTDNPEIASSYAKSRGKPPQFEYDPWQKNVSREEQLAIHNAKLAQNQPNVYPVKLKGSEKVLNMDAPLNAELWRKAGYPEISEQLATKKDATNADAYKKFQQYHLEDGMSKDELSTVSQNLMDKMNIDTIQHKGGLRAGGGETLHNVSIKQNPEDIRSTQAAFDPRFKNSGLILAGTAAAVAPSVTDIMNKPIMAVKEGLETAQNKVNEVTGKAGEAISDLVRPPVPMSQAAIDREHGAANLGGQLALDPTNIIGPATKGLAAAGLIAKMGKSAELAAALEKLKTGSKVTEEASDFTKLIPSLQNLNKEGKLLIKEGLPASAGMGLQNAAKAESELMAAQKVSPKLQDAPGINNAFADLKARNEAKQFAVKSVKAELEAQPALARDNEYLRDRIKSLFNFHILQKNK